MSTLSGLDLAGRRVLVRVDFNVPLEGGAVADDTRIRAALPTIRAILERGGRPVLMSHLGRPKGQVVPELRLDPVARRLEELLGVRVTKLDDSTGPEVEAAVASAPAGTVVLLENVRFHPGETRGDPELAAAYARLGDLFVNDAFGSCHRAHASVSGVAAHLPAYPGLLLEKELAAFRKVLEEPERPFVAILGGAKVSDKLLVIENLLPKVDSVLVGGAMAYTFLAARGVETGSSLVEDERVETVRAVARRAQELGVHLGLPEDHITAERLAADAAAEATEGVAIAAGRMGLDIGPRTRADYAERIGAARTLVWNGPMGVFEMEPFRAGTEAVARAVADCPGFTVVGGGDSVAAVHLCGVADRIDHISTGGGASLELLGGARLPGIACLSS